MRTRTPYRFDIVGSLLRPNSLRQTRHHCACGERSLEEIHRVENREIATLIAKEKAVGLPNITDGGFRHTWRHLDFLFELPSMELAEAEEYSTKFQAHMHHPVTLKITGKIEFPNAYPSLAHLKASREEAGGHPVKLAIPSPSMLYLITCVRAPSPWPTERYAGRNDLLLADTTTAYVKAVNTLYDVGCCILQLDDTSWGESCSEEKCALYQAQGVDVDATTRSYVKMLNDIHAAASADMVLIMHVHHDNLRSAWFSSGGYESVVEVLFDGYNVDGFSLGYGSDRTGSFRSLCFIENQQAVLGPITSKSGRLEDRDAVTGRIKEAAQYVDIDQLCLSPQCDLTSTEEGNVPTEEEQWEKLALIRSIVGEVRGNT